MEDAGLARGEADPCEVLTLEVRDVARRVGDLVDLGTEYREAAAERAVRLTALVNEAADLRSSAQESARAAAAATADLGRAEGRRAQLERELQEARSAAAGAAAELATARGELARLRAVERRADKAEAALASLRRRRSVRAALLAASSAGRVARAVRR